MKSFLVETYSFTRPFPVFAMEHGTQPEAVRCAAGLWSRSGGDVREVVVRDPSGVVVWGRRIATHLKGGRA